VDTTHCQDQLHVINSDETDCLRLRAVQPVAVEQLVQPPNIRLTTDRNAAIRQYDIQQLTDDTRYACRLPTIDWRGYEIIVSLSLLFL